MQLTLSPSIALNPAQVAIMLIVGAHIDPAGSVTLHVQFLDATGKVLDQQMIVANNAQAQTYVANQMAMFYTFLQNKLGVSGTVA